MQLREEQRGLSYPDVRLWRGEAEVLHMSEATANSYCPLGSAYLEMDGDSSDKETEMFWGGTLFADIAVILWIKFEDFIAEGIAVNGEM